MSRILFFIMGIALMVVGVSIGNFVTFTNPLNALLLPAFPFIFGLMVFILAFVKRDD